ncbi:MAG: SpoIIE family protein phosphatase [Treponema sp.]|nr:SpoIIE family protein phosphatase [Treponema sp.]
MKKASNKLHFTSLIVQLPFYIALFGIAISTLNLTVGYFVFKRLFEQQYHDLTQQIAHTALSYINTDTIETYGKTSLADEEWEMTNKKLESLTDTARLAYIYVTIPNLTFKKRTYIYDTVHPEVIKNNPKIFPYPLGKTTSLEKYDHEYISRLKGVMFDRIPYIHFAYNKTGGHVTTSIPLINSNDKVVGILSIVKPMSEVKNLKQFYFTRTILGSALLTIVFTWIYILIVLKQLVHPIITLTHETESFVKHKVSLTQALDTIKGKSELALLARTIEQMSKDIQQYISDLTHTTAEKERLTAELDVAKQIQANMLPQLFPPYENHKELELFATMEPAKEVGGDFYDFFMVDDDHFAVVVGDVSGKGVPAALFMVVAKTLIKNITMKEHNPAKVFEEVNNQLCEGNDAGLFVTCWMGVITLSTGELHFANAGHTFPIIRTEESVDYLKTKPNLVIAGLPNIKYQEHSTTLHKGDCFFMYTDGVTEASNSNNELYGEDRLLQAFKNTKGMTSKEILHYIRKDVDQFVGSAPQFDDITMMEMSLKV